MNTYQVSAAERRKLNISTIFEKSAGLGYSKFSFGRQYIGVSFDTYV